MVSDVGDRPSIVGTTIELLEGTLGLTWQGVKQDFGKTWVVGLAAEGDVISFK